MKSVITLLIISTFLFGCSSIPQSNQTPITKHNVTEIVFKDATGEVIKYGANKQNNQSIQVEVGEEWTVITTTKVKFGNATAQDYIKTDDIVSFYIITEMLENTDSIQD
jgi:hypothetical protein